MSRKVALRLTASAVALAAFGFAGTAMARDVCADEQTYFRHVGVNIDVQCQ